MKIHIIVNIKIVNQLLIDWTRRPISVWKDITLYVFIVSKQLFSMPLFSLWKLSEFVSNSGEFLSNVQVHIILPTKASDNPFLIYFIQDDFQAQCGLCTRSEYQKKFDAAVFQHIVQVLNFRLVYTLVIPFYILIILWYLWHSQSQDVGSK